MSWFIEMIIDWLKQEYLDRLFRALKGEAAKVYLEGMRVTRRILILFSVVVFVAALIGAGFVLVPVALLMFMPWEPQTKAIVAIAIGAVYLLVPLVWIVYTLSEKRWMALTGARDTLRKLQE